MLPKLWKKVLFAICIIACLFNIVSKLVNRNSLEVNLKSVNDGNTIWDALKKDEVNITYTTTTDTIDGVKNSTSNNTEKNEIKSTSTRSINNTSDADDDSEYDNNDRAYRYNSYTFSNDEE